MEDNPASHSTLSYGHIYHQLPYCIGQIESKWADSSVAQQRQI